MKNIDLNSNLVGRDFLTLRDFSREEIEYLIELAAYYKEKKKNGERVDEYRGQNVALIFEKTSTRTRCSFEIAAHDLGMGTTYLDPQGSQIGKKESIADTARVLGSMFEGIEYRGFGQEIVEELFNTHKMDPIVGTGNEAHDILMYVYKALQTKGYDPITQLVGYLVTGEPTYITSYNSARSLICRLERDEILEELVRSYLDTH